MGVTLLLTIYLVANSALLKSLGSRLCIRLSAAMKLLCVYLNTCLDEILGS